MFPRSPRFALAGLTLGLFATATLRADQDVPPVNVNDLLKQLHTLRDQQAVQAKSSKQAAIQAISAAAGSADKAVNFWAEAVKATQMDGGGKEGAQFRAWRDTEGELFKEKEVQNAVHLHLEWLAITLQRSNGVSVKNLLPTIINYTKELQADQAMMEALDDTIKKEKEAPPGAAPGQRRRGAADPAKSDEAIRRTHNEILRTSVSASMITQWMKLQDFVNVDKWEGVPGSFDGIYKNVIQPELRAERDPRVFDYWDFKLKKEAELATKSRLNFEVDKFNSLRRPTLLWNRAQEYAYIGQKNRAVTEMFNLIKTNPTHPDANDWAATLETVLAPPPTDVPATAPATGAPTAAPIPAPAPAPTTSAIPGAPTPTALLPGAQ